MLSGSTLNNAKRQGAHTSSNTFVYCYEKGLKANMAGIYYRFDVLEISSGFLSIPTDDWAELVKMTKSIGLKAKPEVGILFGAGGDTEGLETKGTRDPRWVIERAEKFLAAGADKIMVCLSISLHVYITFCKLNACPPCGVD